MIKVKILNLILGSIMGISIVMAVGSSAYAKVGDNCISNKNMYTYKELKKGKYANIYCNPGYTQVAGNKTGYYGTQKYARYHSSKLIGERKYMVVDDEIKITTSQPCYTTFKQVTDDIARRYHRGYIRMGIDDNSSIVQHYVRTVCK